MNQSPRNTETEIKLVMVGPDRDQLFDALAVIGSIGDFMLGPPTRTVLDDQYFDPNTGANDFALRIRTLPNALLFALKGPAHKNEWGELERMELEGEWSSRLFEEVINHMGRQDLLTKVSKGDLASEDPGSLLQRLGFRFIQRRLAIRIARDIFPPNIKRGPAIGEMDMDRVDFMVGPKSIPHYELELEREPDNKGEDLAALSDEIMKKYPGSFIRWDHDKLATGLALEDMAKAGQIDGSGFPRELTAEHYSLISRKIGKSCNNSETTV